MVHPCCQGRLGIAASPEDERGLFARLAEQGQKLVTSDNIALIYASSEALYVVGNVEVRNPPVAIACLQRVTEDRRHDICLSGIAYAGFCRREGEVLEKLDRSLVFVHILEPLYNVVWLLTSGQRSVQTGHVEDVMRCGVRWIRGDGDCESFKEEAWLSGPVPLVGSFKDTRMSTIHLPKGGGDVDNLIVLRLLESVGGSAH